MTRLAWRREVLEPAEPGPCEEPTCRTIPLGLDVPLLVARYELASGRVIRTCAPCDEWILGRFLERDAANADRAKAEP